MKKHITTALLVTACLGLVVYKMVYNTVLDSNVAAKYKTEKAIKPFKPTQRQDQLALYSRLLNATNPQQVVRVVNQTYNKKMVVLLDNQAESNTLLRKPFTVEATKTHTHKIKVAQPNTIVNPATGTKINIQPNSFVTNYGTVVEGDVTVNIKEMRTAAEFFAYGLPMNNHNAQTIIEFTAVGENGENLALLKEKPLEVMVASATSFSGYSAYRLGEAGKSWELKSTLGNNAVKTKVVVEKSKVANNVSLSLLRKGLNIFKKELRFKMILNYNAYPEFLQYGDVEWVYTGKTGKDIKAIKAGLLKDRSNPHQNKARTGLLFNYWTDVKLNRVDNGVFTMVFTNGNEKFEVPVRMQHIYGHKINKDDMYDQYLSVYNKKISRLKKVEEDENYSGPQPTELPQGFANYTQFSINELGTWSLSKEFCYDNQQSLNVKFYDEDGNAIETTALYHFDATYNSYRVTVGDDMNKFAFSKPGCGIVFAVTNSNEVAVLMPHKLDGVVNNAAKPQNITLKKIRVEDMNDIIKLFTI